MNKEKKFWQHAPFVLLLFIAIVLAVGSGIEQIQDKHPADTPIYTSPFVILLWGICALLALWHLCRSWQRLHFGSKMLHLAMPIMLCGALTSHLTATSGSMELSAGAQPTHGFFTPDNKVAHLPFAVRLDSCEIPRHPKTQQPTDFISHLQISSPDSNNFSAKVSMNRVLRHKGWRIYQTEMSTHRSVLTVYHDPWGIAITYCGYLLLLIGAMASLLHRHGAFRTLLRHPAWKKAVCCGGLLFLLPFNAHAATTSAEDVYLTLLHPELMSGLCLVVGLLGYIESVLHFITSRPTWALSRVLQHIALVSAATWMLALLALRGYIGGYTPFSNGCEAMLTMGVAVAACSIWLSRKFRPLLPFGLLLCGFAIIASTIGSGHTQISSIRPVLNSPLLSWHVVVVMIAYALFTIMALNGMTALLINVCMTTHRAASKDAITFKISLINRLLLYPALLLLAIGIFVGAVWANISWGTYWSWDPKETWALITLLIYAIPAHSVSLPMFTRPKVVNTYCVLAYATVLMTYFGVNYLLGGMHSYVS